YEFTISSNEGNCFVIKTHGLVYQMVVASIVEEIATAKNRVVMELLKAHEAPAIVQEIKNIRWIGTPCIRHQTPYEGEESEADATWAPSSTQSLSPVFVLEVAYTETLDHLRNKARRWVQGTASVRWVLGIKVHPTPVPATVRADLWLWQAGEGGNDSRYLKQVQHKSIVPEQPCEAHLNLELGHFLAAGSTMPNRIRKRVLAIPLSPLQETIVEAAKLVAEDAERRKASKGE
ncbi:MAG: hypothetical protein Q9184_007642, partial [Pyrenodesmia sp. 2 TL-2023]